MEEGGAVAVVRAEILRAAGRTRGTRYWLRLGLALPVVAASVWMFVLADGAGAHAGGQPGALRRALFLSAIGVNGLLLAAGAAGLIAPCSAAIYRIGCTKALRRKLASLTPAQREQVLSSLRYHPLRDTLRIVESLALGLPPGAELSPAPPAAGGEVAADR
jgi:hypothetical protein